jgi:cyclopropane fatty-acyl-phospholipid synthase-like methyltransferase
VASARGRSTRSFGFPCRARIPGKRTKTTAIEPQGFPAFLARQEVPCGEDALKHRQAVNCQAPIDVQGDPVSKDFFAQKAAVYEQDRNRVDNVNTIANEIIKRIELDKGMQLMDFGSGTGLLLEGIAPHVGKITAVDVSPAMNAELAAKRDRLGCDLEMLELDLTTARLDRQFDGILSSMTLHHVRDIPALFAKFRSLLKPGGFIALADLDTEDGSFHTEDTGVHHHGFDREHLAGIARAAGFDDVATTTASVLRKSQGEYPVFLLTGYRPA